MTLEVVGGVLGKSSGADNFLQMPSVAGDPVVASGSNTDGEWTQWADGTQIVSRKSTKPSGGATSYQIMSNIPWPMPFINSDYKVSAQQGNFPSGANAWWNNTAEGLQTDNFTWVTTSSAAWSTDLNVLFVAYGRWK